MSVPAEWQTIIPAPRPLAGKDQWNVFLSYRSANRAWVLNLYDVLRQYDHKVFLDQVVLSAGDELIKRLEEALGASQAGVLIWSVATRDSDWVRREYQAMEQMAAKRPGFRFVPIRLDDGELPVFAANRVFLDFNAYPDGPNGGELLRLLHAIVGQPLSDEAAHLALDQDEASRLVSAQIDAAIRNGRPERLVELFTVGGLPWRTSSALGCKVADGLTKLATYDRAFEVLDALEREFPRAIRPKQLRALAHRRQAAKAADRAQMEQELDAAQDLLGQLYALGERDPETLGIYGATWMERYRMSGQMRDLKQSRDYYVEAFEGATDDYYTGINAATKSVLLGTDEDIARAAEIAARVQAIVGTEPHRDDYWKTATVAELHLIRHAYGNAARVYEAAVSMARRESGSLRTTWIQAADLMDKLQPTDEERARIRAAFADLPGI
jgi:hypothetical protein